MTAIQRDITIGDCRMILGDMREVVPELQGQLKPKDRPTLCLSDVPYRLTSGGKTTGEMSGCFAKDEYDNSGELFDMVEWSEMAPLMFNVLADNANLLVMTSDREEPTARHAFESVGFGFHHLLVWGKNTCTPNRFYMASCEFGLFMYKGRARTITDPGSKQLTGCPQVDVSDKYIPKHHFEGGRRPSPHPTEKPVALMTHWLTNSTDIGDLIIDPFMGSGSTIVAAARTGRAAIGIEKDPKWFEVACARVKEAYEYAQPAAFGVSTPVQEDLPL